jgi:hypothetical protein
MNSKIQTISTAHVLGLSSYSIATDKETAMIAFDVADGKEGETRKFALTIATSMLEWLETTIREVRQSAMPAGAVEMRHPNNDEIIIGHSDQMKGATILEFDQKTPHQRIYAVSNLTALRLADLLVKDVTPRLSAEERLALAKLSKKIITPHH